MDTIEDYFFEEEFSTYSDVTEEDPSQRKIKINSISSNEWNHQAGLVLQEIILKCQPAISLTEITPCEESVSGGDDLKANLGFIQTKVFPSPRKNLKISQVVRTFKLRPVFELFKTVREYML
jgi:hypothetical protein